MSPMIWMNDILYPPPRPLMGELTPLPRQFIPFRTSSSVCPGSPISAPLPHMSMRRR